MSLSVHLLDGLGADRHFNSDVQQVARSLLHQRPLFRTLQGISCPALRSLPRPATKPGSQGTEGRALARHPRRESTIWTERKRQLDFLLKEPSSQRRDRRDGAKGTHQPTPN